MRMGISITVAYAAPGVESIVALSLPAGATVGEAVATSGLCAQHALVSEALAYAIFGQRAAAETPLIDGDRVEITRALLIDPKEVRHARVAGKPPGSATRRRRK